MPITYGTYRVASVQLSDLFLVDIDPPIGQATCEDFLTVYFLQPGRLLVMSDFGQQITVTVAPGGPYAYEDSVLGVSVRITGGSRAAPRSHRLVVTLGLCATQCSTATTGTGFSR